MAFAERSRDHARAGRRIDGLRRPGRKGGPIGRRVAARRPARDRNHDVAGAQAAAVAARRADRGHGRSGDLRHHPAHTPAAPRAEAHHRVDRARHARHIPSRRPHHGARRGLGARRRHRRRDREKRARADRIPRQGSMNALEAEGLHTFYGKSHILHGVGLTVGEGEIVALLGRNGAGKSTTLRSLMGLTHAREGTVRIFGATTTDWPPYRIAALGVGYVPEGRRIFANLTVEENLKVPIERPGPWTIPRIYELFPRLAQRKSNKGRQLSGGEQEMLSISRALLLNPKLLMLDEPSQGLAPLIVQNVFDVIVAMRKEGMSILLVEQNVRAAVEIADRAYVLDDGRVVYEGLAAEFAKDEERVRALAGASAEKWEAAE